MIKTTEQLIDPETAQKLLDRNTQNRPVNTMRVKMYARDMLAGAWKTTHQGIAIDEHGVVADGQHRLHAIIKSGKTVRMQVTTGLPRETVVAIDRGHNRSVTDALNMSIEGTEWVTRSVASATKWAFMLQHSANTADTVYACAKTMEKSLRFVSKYIVTSRTGISRGSVLAALALIHDAGEDPDVLSEFCKKLVSGVVNGEKESSIVRLREYLMETVTSSSHPGNIKVMGNTMRAFQLFRDGIQCKRLVAPETLPYPRKKLKE